MAFEQPGFKPTALSASADQTGNQYKFVKISGSLTVTVCAAITDQIFGVLQDEPLSGEAAEIVSTGITKVVAGGTITAGDPIGTDANGKAVKVTVGTDTTKYAVGYALDSAVSGDIVPIFINVVPNRAA